MTQISGTQERFRIFLPNGEPEDIFYNSTTDKNAVVEKYIKQWESFCSDNWMNVRPCGGMTAEARVKRFLQGLSDFSLKGDTTTKNDDYPTLTEWKERQVNEREVPVHMAGSPDDGSSPSLINKVATSRSAFLGERGYRKNTMKNEPVSGSFSRFSEFKRQNPSSRLQVVIVDAANKFSFEGESFQISPAAVQYAPIHTEEGIRYNMDKVCVAVHALTGRLMAYFDQYGNTLPSELITKAVN